MHTQKPSTLPRLGAALVASMLALNAQPVAPSAPKSTWATTTSITVKESFDTNVYLQDVSDLARQDSLVTSLAASVGVTYQTGASFKAAVSYSPEAVFFHSASSEDNVTHRGAVNVSGKSGDLTWEVLNNVIAIDGSDQGPSFLPAQGGDIPAFGGIPLRDRRDAAIYRNSFKLTQTLGSWFVRPTAAAYVHDFQTQQRPRTGVYAGYENYVDRSELSGGVDVGYKTGQNTWLVLGYRYGHQEQKQLLGASSRYSNDFQRLLVGIEGTLGSRVKLNVLAGPDWRSFEENPNPYFDENPVLLFVDASATFTLTSQDTLALAVRRFEQPAFSSHSVYEDIVYDIVWRRKISDALALSAGFRMYGGDWPAPFDREDWLYTPSATLSYTASKKLTLELAYSYDSAESKVSNTAGREYTRHLGSLGVKYIF